MPKTTWFNLDDTKRRRVLDAAMAEFGRRGFSGGSLNVIARDAGVAKGSLFQYFDDKLELYAFVCDGCSARVRDEVARHIDGAQVDCDLFTLLRQTLRDWLSYFEDHPLERGVTFAVNAEIDPQVRATVRRVANRHYLEVLRPLLARAVERGDLRDADAGERLLAWLLMSLPHLAMACHDPDVDPVLGLHRATATERGAIIDRLVDDLAAAYAPAPLKEPT